jgi:C-terminal processing protease CtpA/Prc
MVFLIGSGAISYAESVMGIVEAYHLGELVGEATAGCNGNINRFALPGGIEASWTGMRVLKHDGSEHMGVGIKPSVPVALTIAGIRSGRDEVLERGVEIARGTRTVGKQP